MSASISWNTEFLGVAYRYYDLRMNVVPLFSVRKEATNLWHDVVNWWIDPSIRLRFVESKDDYWFILGSDSKRSQNNVNFFKVLSKSENYERFKKGHDGEAYLRFGVYSEKNKKNSKGKDVCNCKHDAEDHDNEGCLIEDCECTKFETFQLDILKRKKIITDIKFLDEHNVKDDPLAWNCLYLHKYSKSEK